MNATAIVYKLLEDGDEFDPKSLLDPPEWDIVQDLIQHVKSITGLRTEVQVRTDYRAVHDPALRTIRLLLSGPTIRFDLTDRITQSLIEFLQGHQYKVALWDREWMGTKLSVSLTFALLDP